MKKILLSTVLFSLLIITIFSCNKNETKPTPTLAAVASTQNLGFAAGTLTLSVTSNTDWTVSSGASWCTVSPATGSSNGTVTVTYQANSTNVTRNANITLSASGVASVVISLTQAKEDVLCNGKSGNLSYMPLAMSNSWTYGAQPSGGASPYSSSVTSTTTFNGISYFVVTKVFSSGNTSERYFRIAANNDVYYYLVSTDTEYLLLPASPTVNQQLGEDIDLQGSGSTTKVISTNASTTTNKCTYNNCLQIEIKAQNGAFIGYKYYKKGLGLIRATYSVLEDATIN